MRLRIPATVPLEKIGSFPKLVGMGNSDNVMVGGKEYLVGTLEFFGFSSKRDGQVYHGHYIFDKVDIPFLGESEMFSFVESLPGIVGFIPVETCTPVVEGDGIVVGEEAVETFEGVFSNEGDES